MQYVLVTGAYGGMGKATVTALKNAGYTVFALDRQLCEKQEGIIPLQADVTDSESLKAALLEVQKTTSTLFAIVHFAGVYALDSLIEIPEEKFTKTFDINLFGVYRINKIFSILLCKGSRIIITTSELAPLDPLPFTGLYAITKSALDKYAFSLRMETQLSGISVSVLRPGAVKTDMIGASTAALDTFCQNTRLYTCNAKRFKKIVDSVEARNVSPDRVARKAVKILTAKRPKHVYALNRNPLLLLLNVLPSRTQTWIIKKILK